MTQSGLDGIVSSEADVEYSDRLVDDLLRAVTDRNRRRVLNLLVAADESSVSFDAMLADLSGKTSSPTDRIAVSLRHRHLPALDDVGLIDDDDETETITYHPCPFVEEVLATAERLSVESS